MVTELNAGPHLSVTKKSTLKERGYIRVRVRAPAVMCHVSRSHARHKYSPWHFIFNSMQCQCQCQYKTDPRARITCIIQILISICQSVLQHSFNVKYADNEFFMAEVGGIVSSVAWYNLNLLRGEVMTACHGKPCHCYVLVDCPHSGPSNWSHSVPPSCPPHKQSDASRKWRLTSNYIS